MEAAVNYNHIADQLIADVKNGILKPGQRLLPQREFAYLHNIAPSTASRVYAELVKRGVAIGEVGRGTYIRAFDQIPPTLGEPAKEPINMQLNFSVLPEQAGEMAQELKALTRHDVLEASLEPVGVQKDDANMRITANFLRQRDWPVSPDNILYTGGGRQGLTAALAAVASIGDRVGVEYLTYTVVMGIAARLGIQLVPIDMDEDGICLKSLQKSHQKAPLKAIYIQPTLHNPLGVSMSEQRRGDLANYIKKENIIAIEDAVYAFLVNAEPFAALAPENTIYVDSLSKRLSPGLGYGMMVTPGPLINKCIASIRMGGWTTSSIPFELCQRLMASGSVDRISELRRLDAKKRQSIAKKALSDFTIHSDPRSYHLWMELPKPWRAEEFAAHAADKGVSITPANLCAVEPGNAPNAVRLALAPPSFEQLDVGLEIIKNLALQEAQ
tara:strand:+ start:20286 stop:21611 length:1326 start_codon:yes stop_codon:yes gene_type:complete